MKEKEAQQEKIEDRVAERVIEALGKTYIIRRLRSSHILSGLIGIIGLALLLAGVEKIFANLSGLASVILGLLLLTLSGVLFHTLIK